MRCTWFESVSLKDTILKNAKEHDVAFLVGGDPLSATTHTDLILRAVELNVPYKIVHNASIMNAIGSSGLQVRTVPLSKGGSLHSTLQLYHFGETVSIVFWTETWRPTSFCEKIVANRRRGLHTLCLLGSLFFVHCCHTHWLVFFRHQSERTRWSQLHEVCWLSSSGIGHW